MAEELKLKVDFGDGMAFDGSGDPERVERLFREYSERVERLRLSAASRSNDVDEQEEAALSKAETVEEALRIRKRKRPTRTTNKAPADGGGLKMADYSPVRIKDLDLSGLEAFYREWAPKNHPERILLFAHYLQEHLQIAPCSADHIFSCYLQMKERIPKAFVQAFRDASGNDYGYIEFNSLSDISIPIHGRNHVEHGGIQKKTAART